MRSAGAWRLELASNKPAPASPDFFSWLEVSVADRDLLWPRPRGLVVRGRLRRAPL